MDIIQGNFNDNAHILSKMIKKTQANSMANMNKDTKVKYQEAVSILLCCYDFVFKNYGVDNDMNFKLDCAIALYAKTGQFTHLAIVCVDDYILRTATNGSVSHLFFSLRQPLKMRAIEILKNLKNTEEENKTEFTKDEIKRLHLIAEGKWFDVLDHINEIEKKEFEKMEKEENEKCQQALEKN